MKKFKKVRFQFEKWPSRTRYNLKPVEHPITLGAIEANKEQVEAELRLIKANMNKGILSLALVPETFKAIKEELKVKKGERTILIYCDSILTFQLMEKDDSLSKEEAIQALRAGKKLSNKEFDHEGYMYIEGDNIFAIRAGDEPLQLNEDKDTAEDILEQMTNASRLPRGWFIVE